MAAVHRTVELEDHQADVQITRLGVLRPGRLHRRNKRPEDRRTVAEAVDDSLLFQKDETKTQPAVRRSAQARFDPGRTGSEHGLLSQTNVPKSGPKHART